MILLWNSVVDTEIWPLYLKKKINKKCKYIIFDTPEVNLLQFYYLKRNKIPVSFHKVNSNSVALISSYKKLNQILKKFKK